MLLAMHEAIHQQVLSSEEIDNIQHHHNSYRGIRGLLQEWVVKHPPVEYPLRGYDTQAPRITSDRLFFVTRAAIELQKSNKDWSPLNWYGKCCHGPLWPWSGKIRPMDGWRVYRPALRRIFNRSCGSRPCFWPMITHTWSRSSLTVAQPSSTLRSP